MVCILQDMKARLLAQEAQVESEELLAPIPEQPKPHVCDDANDDDDMGLDDQALKEVRMVLRCFP